MRVERRAWVARVHRFRMFANFMRRSETSPFRKISPLFLAGFIHVVKEPDTRDTLISSTIVLILRMVY